MSNLNAGLGFRHQVCINSIDVKLICNNFGFFAEMKFIITYLWFSFLTAEGLGKLKKPCLIRQSFNSIHGSTQSLRSSLSTTRRPPSEITFGRKVSSQGSNILLTGSSSTPPLMKTTKASKTEVENSCQSTPTSSWYGSPSSSIDKWPLDSATQRSNRSKRSPYSSLRSSLVENENRRRHRKDHKEDGNADTSSILREVKPSSLRMPSPNSGDGSIL